MKLFKSQKHVVVIQAACHLEAAVLLWRETMEGHRGMPRVVWVSVAQREEIVRKIFSVIQEHCEQWNRREPQIFCKHLYHGRMEEYLLSIFMDQKSGETFGEAAKGESELEGHSENTLDNNDAPLKKPSMDDDGFKQNGTEKSVKENRLEEMGTEEHNKDVKRTRNGVVDRCQRRKLKMERSVNPPRGVIRC
eukprot:Gb_30686 [translate_table: standard]